MDHHSPAGRRSVRPDDLPLPAAPALGADRLAEGRPVVWLLATLIVTLIVVAGMAAGATTPVVVGPVVAPPAGPPAAGSVEAAVARAAPAVVSIQAGPLSGSGFLIADRTVVTGWHVVSDDRDPDPGGQVAVTLSDGQTVPGRVVALDPAIDLAVVDLARPVAGVAPLRFADAATIRPGQPVVAIGTPSGLAQTVTVGVVSHPARNDARLRLSPAQVNMVQTDTPVSPGSSGGPLLDMAGDVVGVLLLRPEFDDANRRLDGVALALRADQAAAAVRQVADHGDIRHPFLGVGVAPTAGTPGVVVAQVLPDGPAVGLLQPGDVVVSAGGLSVASTEDLLAVVAGLRPGVLLPVVVVRDGGPVTVVVPVADRPL